MDTVLDEAVALVVELQKKLPQKRSGSKMNRSDRLSAPKRSRLDELKEMTAEKDDPAPEERKETEKEWHSLDEDIVKNARETIETAAMLCSGEKEVLRAENVQKATIEPCVNVLGRIDTIEQAMEDLKNVRDDVGGLEESIRKESV